MEKVIELFTALNLSDRVRLNSDVVSFIKNGVEIYSCCRPEFDCAQQLLAMINQEDYVTVVEEEDGCVVEAVFPMNCAH